MPVAGPAVDALCSVGVILRWVTKVSVNEFWRLSAVDAVDGSSHRHLGAKMVAFEETIEREADHD